MLTVAPTGSTNLVMRRSTPRPSSRQRKVMGSVAELGEREPRGLRAGDGRAGLEQQWTKGGLPLRTLEGQVGGRERGGWQVSNISEADNCMRKRDSSQHRVQTNGVLQAEGLLTHLKPITRLITRLIDATSSL